VMMNSLILLGYSGSSLSLSNAAASSIGVVNHSSRHASTAWLRLRERSDLQGSLQGCGWIGPTGDGCSRS
jgi:hypothetical protein